MRPKEDEKGDEIYECLACGERFESPDTRACPECGEELRHLGRSRDL